MVIIIITIIIDADADDDDDVRLREIPSDDLSLPSQSLRCHLAGIGPATETRLSQADVTQAMWRVFAGKALLAVVKVRNVYRTMLSFILYTRGPNYKNIL